MRNGNVKLFPAYDADIKPNTFVSIKDSQADANDLILSDSLIVNSTASDAVEYGTTYKLDANHYILIWCIATTVYARIITKGTNYTLGSKVTLGSYSGTTINDLWVAKEGNNNRFVAHASYDTIDDTRKAVTITFSVSSSWTITVLKTVTGNELNRNTSSASHSSIRGIQSITYCGNNLFLVNGYILKSDLFETASFASKNLYQIDSAGNFTSVYQIEEGRNASSSLSYQLCIGFTPGGKAIVSTSGTTALGIYTVTSSSFTKVASGSALHNIRLMASCVKVSTNKYVIAYETYIELYTITDTSITRNAAVTFSEANMGNNRPSYNSNLLWDSASKLLFIMNPSVFTYPIFTIKINVSNNTIDTTVKYHWAYCAPLGAWIDSSNVIIGIADKPTAQTKSLGLARWNMKAQQNCIIDSLETNVITGVTLSTCTRDKAGKVCVLDDSTTLNAAYGISNTVVTQIIDDSIDTIQQEVKNSAD